MIYDLPIIAEYCIELGFRVIENSDDVVKIEVEKGVTLEFMNIDNNSDSLVGFSGTPWHGHGDLVFVVENGKYIELTPLDILQDLKLGRVLLLETWREGKLEDRAILHSESEETFEYMQPGDEYRIRRIA